MKIFLLSVFSIYLAMDFVGSFAAWMKSKGNKEYWLRFVDTMVSGALMCAFVKLVDILVSGVA